jgi:hypothetical protein
MNPDYDDVQNVRRLVVALGDSAEHPRRAIALLQDIQRMLAAITPTDTDIAPVIDAITIDLFTGTAIIYVCEDMFCGSPEAIDKLMALDQSGTFVSAA